MLTLEIVKDSDFYFMNKDIKRLQTKYKKNETILRKRFGDKLGYFSRWKLRDLKDEIIEKKLILSTRYLKKKLPDEIIYEIYKYI